MWRPRSLQCIASPEPLPASKGKAAGNFGKDREGKAGKEQKGRGGIIPPLPPIWDPLLLPAT